MFTALHSLGAFLSRTCFTLFLAAAALPAAWAQSPSPAATTQRTVEPTSEPRFDLLELLVEGDTVLGAAAIERAVYPFLGLQKTAADAEGARKALERAYELAGYASVKVFLPPQQVGASGELRLQVLQAAIEKLRVTGAEYTLPSQVRAAVPSLAVGSVPNFNELQQELAVLGQASADREVTPILAAGDAPGTLAVELKLAKDELPLHGHLEANSQQSQNTTRGRVDASLRYDNLFQAGHSLGLAWQVAPRRVGDLNIQTLTYAVPLGGVGDRASLAYTHSNSNTPTALAGQTVARGDTWRLNWRDQLQSRGGIDHGFTWGLTFRDERDSNKDVAGVNTATGGLRYTTIDLGYDLSFAGPAGEGGAASSGMRTTNLTARLVISPSGFNRREVDCNGRLVGQFACKRAEATPGFQVLKLNISHREPVLGWPVTLRLQGQLSDQPLASAEQVQYGGVDTVRGYLESERVGDLGAAATLELSTPTWAALQGLNLRALAFYDHALLRRLKPLPQEATEQRLASTGLGLRLETRFGLTASLDWARWLIDTSKLDRLAAPANPASPGLRVRDKTRWDLSVRQSF